MKQTIAQYLVKRLHAIGIDACFGLPGDYAIPIAKAVVTSGIVKWIGCSDELNAGYAADGYARINGYAMLCTTYGAGELSAVNALMGAKAEHTAIFHVVGWPSTSLQNEHAIVHHTLGDGDFSHFISIAKSVSCATAVLTRENYAAEIERIISAVKKHKQPGYIGIPSDVSLHEIDSNQDTKEPSISFISNPDKLQQVIDLLTHKLQDAQSIVSFAAYTLSRYNFQTQALQFLEHFIIPYASILMDKGVLPETNSLFLGMFSGRFVTEPKLYETVINADIILDLGGIVLSDVSLRCDLNCLEHKDIITIGIDHVVINHTKYTDVSFVDVIKALLSDETLSLDFTRPTINKPKLSNPPQNDGVITSEDLFLHYHRLIRPNDIFIAETGSSCMLCMNLPLPENVTFFHQTLWCSIGWGTGAALGTSIAERKRRTVLITGEGAHQLTVGEIGTMAKHKLLPVILVINNCGYMVERAVSKACDINLEYNDIDLGNTIDYLKFLEPKVGIV